VDLDARPDPELTRVAVTPARHLVIGSDGAEMLGPDGGVHDTQAFALDTGNGTDAPALAAVESIAAGVDAGSAAEGKLTGAGAFSTRARGAGRTRGIAAPAMGGITRRVHTLAATVGQDAGWFLVLVGIRVAVSLEIRVGIRVGIPIGISVRTRVMLALGEQHRCEQQGDEGLRSQTHR
jgi:hypothetical protein